MGDVFADMVTPITAMLCPCSVWNFRASRLHKCALTWMEATFERFEALVNHPLCVYTLRLCRVVLRTITLIQIETDFSTGLQWKFWRLFISQRGSSWDKKFLESLVTTGAMQWRELKWTAGIAPSPLTSRVSKWLRVLFHAVVCLGSVGGVEEDEDLDLKQNALQNQVHQEQGSLFSWKGAWFDYHKTKHSQLLPGIEPLLRIRFDGSLSSCYSPGPFYKL